MSPGQAQVYFQYNMPKLSRPCTEISNVAPAAKPFRLKQLIHSIAAKLANTELALVNSVTRTMFTPSMELNDFAL